MNNDLKGIKYAIFENKEINMELSRLKIQECEA